jgi:hypothetical protein
MVERQRMERERLAERLKSYRRAKEILSNGKSCSVSTMD